MIWFGSALCHINNCRLFNAKYILNMYMKYIWFGLVGFMAYQPLWDTKCKILFKYIYQIHIWLGWILWHINHCRLFNAKYFLYIYMKYIWFGLVGFHGISTIVGYLIFFNTYILNLFDLVWLGFMVYQSL